MILWIKTATFCPKGEKTRWRSNWYWERVPDFGTLVKDCKLLKTCSTRMRSIVVGCSGAIIMPLATPARLSPRPSRSLDFDDVSQTNCPDRATQTNDRGEILRPKN